MQYATLSIPLLALVAAGVAMAQSVVTVNTPVTLITCQPILLTWTGGQPPYFPRITEGGNTAATLNTFDTTDSTSLTWTVDLAAGTVITVAVTDSTGANGASAQVTVNAGSTSCLDDDDDDDDETSSAPAPSSTSASSASTSSSAAPTTSSASAPATSATTSRTTSAGTSTAATTTSGSGSATTSAAPNAAVSARGFSAAVAGLVGAAAAALL